MVIMGKSTVKYEKQRAVSDSASRRSIASNASMSNTDVDNSNNNRPNTTVKNPSIKPQPLTPAPKSSAKPFFRMSTPYIKPVSPWTTSSITKSRTSTALTKASRKKITAEKILAPQLRQKSVYISKSLVSIDKSQQFHIFVEKAMRNHKIFSCCGGYPGIRNALRRRGWVQKPGPLALSYTRSYSRNFPLSKQTLNAYSPARPQTESDLVWMARTLREYPPDFSWTHRRDVDWKNLKKDQLINRFPRALFTTKVGLTASLQNMHWFSEAGVADTFYPRCYRLMHDEERQAFQDDYRLTACMSYLRYFVNTYETKGHNGLADRNSKITPLSIDFAARQLGNYIRMRRHEDIDWQSTPNYMSQHWDAFIQQYYAIVHDKKHLRFESQVAVKVKYEIAKKALIKVAPYWSQTQLDGVQNMWICKPGAKSRGQGILIRNKLEVIMDLLSRPNFRESNWVVQKYIERPLLVYNTKFDMRQWFLVTDWAPLTVWFYKDSYVRFCTKPFVLQNFHESIHLCNNAIQSRYQNSNKRDSNLPRENMWSSDTFQAYLKSIGKPDAWRTIYSGMKQAIVGVLLASQENMESRKGCFELYGADFMLTEDLRPWLIEINSSPCMASTTKVTARMCAQCLEDTIKVVVDRRKDKTADTGRFEIIYRQNPASTSVQLFNGYELTVYGRRLTRDINWPTKMSSWNNNSVSKHRYTASSIIANSHSTSNTSNTTQSLSQLLEIARVRSQHTPQASIGSSQSRQRSRKNSLSQRNLKTPSMTKPPSKSRRNAEIAAVAASLLRKMRPVKSGSLTSSTNVSKKPTVENLRKQSNFINNNPNPSKPGVATPVEKEKIKNALASINDSLAYLIKNRNKSKSSEALSYLVQMGKNLAQKSGLHKVAKQATNMNSDQRPMSSSVTNEGSQELAKWRAFVERTGKEMLPEKNGNEKSD